MAAKRSAWPHPLPSHSCVRLRWWLLALKGLVLRRRHPGGCNQASTCTTRHYPHRNILEASTVFLLWDNTDRAGAIKDKSSLFPSIAGNNRNNYLIIPTASTAPRERVTGVQQCLCCTQCLQHVPLKQKMEIQFTTVGLDRWTLGVFLVGWLVAVVFLKGGWWCCVGSVQFICLLIYFFHLFI